jgi:hypothetical protein
VSNALAIGAVTAVLKDLLDNGLIDRNVGSSVGNVSVSVLPPDRVIPLNGPEPDQLNLFLYQVTHNPGWSNMDLPSRDGNGRRASDPLLALDLHYLLTTYGSDKFHAEILLGYAMQILHETSVLSRKAIREALQVPSPVGGGILPPAFRALSAAELADQVEQIKICPDSLNIEEVSKLWAAFQTAYRTTIAYQASVVLIESEKPARSPLPVLRRDITIQPSTMPPLPPFPTLETLNFPNRQTSVRLGETFTIRGHRLGGGTVVARFSHPLLSTPIEIPVPAGSRTPTELSVQLPNAPANWPAGLYSLAVIVRGAGRPDQTTNELPLLLAPKITTTPMPTSVTRGGNGDATLPLTCSPEVWPKQRVSLLLGGREVFAEDHPLQTDSMRFVIKNAPLGEHLLRLRVDGVESIIVKRPADSPPTFDETQKVRIT